MSRPGTNECQIEHQQLECGGLQAVHTGATVTAVTAESL